MCMKRNLFSKVFVTMTATAVMGLASCSSDNDPAGGQVEQGKATGMQLVLDLGGTATRAITDPNATADESTIENLNVFIYGANGVFEKEYTIPFAQLTDAGDNKYTTKELIATTGSKTIYVGANMTGGMIGLMKGTSANGLSGKGVNETLANISTAKKFVMFSTVGATPTLIEDNDNDPDTTPTENQIKVTLQRLASKVSVGMTKNLADNGVQLGAAGTIEDLKFTVDNINKMYYLTYGAAVAAKDANMTADQYDVTDFEMVADFATHADYQNITIGQAANWGIKYAAENLTTDKMMKGVTRIVVQGSFTPEKVITVTGDAANGWTYTEAAGTKGATYKMLNVGGYAFFVEGTTTDQLKAYLKEKAGVADDQLDAEAAKAVTYNKGMNYWWVTVKENQGDMLRNNYYKVDITSIWAPGRNDGKFDDNKDDKPIDKETNITVEVTVEPWNMKNFDADLRP